MLLFNHGQYTFQFLFPPIHGQVQLELLGCMHVRRTLPLDPEEIFYYFDIFQLMWKNSILIFFRQWICNNIHQLQKIMSSK